MIAQQQPSGVISHASNVSDQCGVTGRNAEAEEVGSRLRDGLTADQRESAIRLACSIVLKHWARYTETECFGDRAMYDRAMVSLRSLVRGTEGSVG